MITRLALMLLICGVAVSAGPQATRDRGGAPPPAIGRGVIAGTIVTDDASARPVRRATVTLVGSVFAASRLAVTDDDGRFAFGELPSGSFNISVEKPAYVRLFYGGKRPGRGPSVPIALADGQRVNLSMKMVHGAAITGTVLDASGRPAPQVSIQVVARQGTGATRSFSSGPAGSTTTDDRGVFRIFGLAPGDYVVFALPRSTGVDADLHTVTAEELRWAQGRASGAVPVGAPLPPAEPAIGYARVYYPGTLRGSEALAITLGAGEERTASFALQFITTARIDGTVVDPTGGAAQNAQVSVALKDTGVSGDTRIDPFALAAISGRVLVVDGKFALLSVPPGAYTILVRGGPATPAGVAGAGRGGRGGAAAPSPWWGEADIIVDGHDQSGVSIVMQPSMTVMGKIVFDGTTAAPVPATRVRVTLASADPTRPSADSIATVNADGAFVVPNMAPGRYTMRATITPSGSGWAFKSAMLAGHDAADVPLTIEAGRDVAGAVVTFTDRPTDISGVLSDAAGRGTPEFSIVVFSTDRSAWTDGSRRVRVTRAGSNGAFQITGLPPGGYYVAAVRDYDPPDLADASFLEQLTAASYQITLADGEHKKQDLKISGGGWN